MASINYNLSTQNIIEVIRQIGSIYNVNIPEINENQRYSIKQLHNIIFSSGLCLTKATTLQSIPMRCNIYHLLCYGNELYVIHFHKGIFKYYDSGSIIKLQHQDGVVYTITQGKTWEDPNINKKCKLLLSDGLNTPLLFNTLFEDTISLDELYTEEISLLLKDDEN